MKESQFQFNNPTLHQLSFDVNSDFNSELFSTISLGGETEIKKAKDKPIAVVTLTIAVGDKQPQYPFHIVVKMSANFRWDISVNDDVVNQLLHNNAPALILSYIRPIVANITSNSPFSQFDLPYMDFRDNKAIEIVD